MLGRIGKTGSRTSKEPEERKHQVVTWYIFEARTQPSKKKDASTWCAIQVVAASERCPPKAGHQFESSTAYLRSLEDLKAEAQSDRGIDVVALEKAEGQSAIHLVEHHAKIEIPLWRKSPVHCGRNRIVRPGALRVLTAEAGGRPGWGAEEVVLDIMVIGGDDIHVFGNSVFAPDPHDLQSLVPKTVHAEGGIVDIRVVEGGAGQAKKGSRDIGKSDLRIAGRHVSNIFVTGVQLQRSVRVFGHSHHGVVVGDLRREGLWQERGYRHAIGVIASRCK
jgi:hypothetical protein